MEKIVCYSQSPRGGGPTGKQQGWSEGRGYRQKSQAILFCCGFCRKGKAGYVG